MRFFFFFFTHRESLSVFSFVFLTLLESLSGGTKRAAMELKGSGNSLWLHVSSRD